VSLDEPKPLVYAARNLRENVSRIGIPQFTCLINRLARFVAEGG
jgi:hypothetical protein